MKTGLMCSYHRGIATITMRGRAGFGNLDALRHYVDEALDRSTSLVAIDLSGVDTIDSSAVGALITAHRRSIDAGSSLTLIAPSSPVRRKLNQTRLDEVFPIVEEVPAAWRLPQAVSSPDQNFQDLLDFVESRARDDIRGTCQFCPQDAHLIDVGTMASDWVDRVRPVVPTDRQLAWSAWIAGIHRDHDDYRASWDDLHTALP